MSFNVKIEGMDELLKKVKDLDRETRQKVDKEIGDSVIEMERTMKDLAPVNDGILKSQISHSRVDSLTWQIVSWAPYSAYMEFGTKKKYDPVTGYEQLAAAAKGKGKGSWNDFLKSLERWVEKKITRKNAKGIAFLIARSIMVNGVSGNHYFTRGIERHKRGMMERLKKIVEG